MPQATLADLIDEVNATLATVLASEDVQVVSGFNLAPTPPSVDIYPSDQARGTDSMGFGDIAGEVFLTVRARVGTADTDAGQAFLLRLCDEEDALSVAAALMDDQSLNGLASSVSVDAQTGFAPYADNPGMLLGCEWRVRILRTLS